MSYDPGVGRFLNEDPLGLDPDSNPYRFVSNSPLNFTDPSGLTQAGNPLDALAGAYAPAPTSDTFRSEVLDIFASSQISTVDFARQTPTISAFDTFSPTVDLRAAPVTATPAPLAFDPLTVVEASALERFRQIEASRNRPSLVQQIYRRGETLGERVGDGATASPSMSFTARQNNPRRALEILANPQIMGDAANDAVIDEAFGTFSGRLSAPLADGAGVVDRRTSGAIAAAELSVEVGLTVQGLPAVGRQTAVGVSRGAVRGSVRGPVRPTTTAPEVVETLAPQSQPWRPGRYSAPASRHGAYLDSGGRVFPTRRNSGLSGQQLRAEQEAFTLRQLEAGRLPDSIRGQAREAGLTVNGQNAVLADRGAEKAVQRAIDSYEGAN